MENEQSFSEFWAISQAQTQFGSIFDLPQIHVMPERGAAMEPRKKRMRRPRLSQIRGSRLAPSGDTV